MFLGLHSSLHPWSFLRSIHQHLGWDPCFPPSQLHICGPLFSIPLLLGLLMFSDRFKCSHHCSHPLISPNPLLHPALLACFLPQSPKAFDILVSPARTISPFVLTLNSPHFRSSLKWHLHRRLFLNPQTKLLCPVISLIPSRQASPCLEHWAYFSACSEITLFLCCAQHPGHLVTPTLSTMPIHSWCPLNACHVDAWKSPVYACHMLGAGYISTSFPGLGRRNSNSLFWNFYRWCCIGGWGHLCSGHSPLWIAGFWPPGAWLSDPGVVFTCTERWLLLEGCVGGCICWSRVRKTPESRFIGKLYFYYL